MLLTVSLRLVWEACGAGAYQYPFCPRKEHDWYENRKEEASQDDESSNNTRL